MTVCCRLLAMGRAAVLPRSRHHGIWRMLRLLRLLRLLQSTNQCHEGSAIYLCLLSNKRGREAPEAARLLSLRSAIPAPPCPDPSAALQPSPQVD